MESQGEKYQPLEVLNNPLRTLLMTLVVDCLSTILSKYLDLGLAKGFNVKNHNIVSMLYLTVISLLFCNVHFPDES